MTEEVTQELEHGFDMDNPPVVIHQWVDRGLFMSCEKAGHPSHRHYKG